MTPHHAENTRMSHNMQLINILRAVSFINFDRTMRLKFLPHMHARGKFRAGINERRPSPCIGKFMPLRCFVHHDLFYLLNWASSNGHKARCPQDSLVSGRNCAQVTSFVGPAFCMFKNMPV